MRLDAKAIDTAGISVTRLRYQALIITAVLVGLMFVTVVGLEIGGNLAWSPLRGTVVDAEERPVRNFRIDMTGPKISSRAIFISSVTSVKIVGWMK